MTCREMAEFLLDYDSGELPEEVRVTFDEHLERCPECVCYLKNYAFTVRACREASTVRDLPPLPEELIKAILASRPQGH